MHTHKEILRGNSASKGRNKTVLRKTQQITHFFFKKENMCNNKKWINSKKWVNNRVKSLYL